MKKQWLNNGCYSLTGLLVLATVSTEIPFAQELRYKNEVSIKIEGDKRVIRANGIPDHQPGQFPNRGNPNSVLPQQYTFTVPAKPVYREETTSVDRLIFGVALNGVVFDPATAEFWRNDRSSGWNIEALTKGPSLGIDWSNAHVQPTGAYHYHGIPQGLINTLKKDGQPTLVGFAADGFPIYNQEGYTDAADMNSPLRTLKSSWRLKSGTRPTGPRGTYDGTYTADWEYVRGLGDLDESNGRFGKTPEYPDGIYYYVITKEFPMIGRTFHGTPDQSFRHGPPSFGGPGGRPGFPPPPPPIRRGGGGEESRSSNQDIPHSHGGSQTHSH
ncbi:MAG: YHYH protein [Armatimonadetes bacterium]|nr:YHYH protein [Armatimonadota bacterium]